MAGKGYRITTAEDDDGQRVRPYMIDERPCPFVTPLKCGFCSQPVHSVPSHTREGEPVNAYFRLFSGGEHDADCDLHPTRVLQEIARGSHGLASVGDDGILRLTIPDQDTPAPEPPDDSDEDRDGDAEKTALRITTTTPWLPPALGSAVKIARFLRQCDFDPDAVRRFKVLHGARTVSWPNFCFGPDHDSLARLHKRVAGTRPRGRRLSHPVAVHGTVLRRGRSKSGKPFVVLAHDIAPDTGGSGRKVEVVLRSDYPTLLKPLTPGRHVLAVGDRWKIFSPKGVEEVQLWIEEHWSLASWTWDEATGTAGEPECPPPLSPTQRRTTAAQRPPQAKARKRTTVEQRLNAAHKAHPRAGMGKRPARRRRPSPPAPGPRPAPQPLRDPTTPAASTNDTPAEEHPAPRKNAPDTPAQHGDTTAPTQPETSPQPSAAEPTEERTEPPTPAAPQEGNAPAAASTPPMPAHPPRPAHTPNPTPPRTAPAPMPTETRTAKAGLRGLLDRWRNRR